MCTEKFVSTISHRVRLKYVDLGDTRLACTDKGPLVDACLSRGVTPDIKDIRASLPPTPNGVHFPAYLYNVDGKFYFSRSYAEAQGSDVKQVLWTEGYSSDALVMAAVVAGQVSAAYFPQQYGYNSTESLAVVGCNSDGIYLLKWDAENGAPCVVEGDKHSGEFSGEDYSVFSGAISGNGAAGRKFDADYDVMTVKTGAGYVTLLRSANRQDTKVYIAGELRPVVIYCALTSVTFSESLVRMLFQVKIGSALPAQEKVPGIFNMQVSSLAGVSGLLTRAYNAGVISAYGVPGIDPSVNYMTFNKLNAGYLQFSAEEFMALQSEVKAHNVAAANAIRRSHIRI